MRNPVLLAACFISPLIICLSSLGCDAEPVSPVGPTQPAGPTLPPGTIVAPGSELERRLQGECVPFDPWQDGSGRTVCVMTTPQDGTLGRLTAEGVDEIAAPPVGGATEALLDSPPTSLPAVVDHRSEYLDGCVSVSHQLACGWCTIHAATAALEALHCSKGCEAPELSESQLAANSQGGRDFGSCDSGFFIDRVAAALTDAPVAPAETWPYVPNGRGQNEARPSDAVLMENAVHQATGWHSFDPYDLRELKAQLASGREVIITVPVYQPNSPMTARNDWDDNVAFVWAPPVPYPCGCGQDGCTDEVCLIGYHSIVLTGYDDNTDDFVFLNSWGKTWGDGGYGRMSYDFVKHQANAAVVLDDVRTDVPGATCAEEPGADAGSGDAGVPGPSGGCARASNCASCTTLSGCGWCDGVGCQDDFEAGSCADWHGATCPEASDPCAGVSGGCASCLGTAGCQWCASASRCFSPASHSLECGDPRNAVDQCDNCTAADCGACAALEGCGWCPPTEGASGQCVTGSNIAPDRAGACGGYQGTTEACTADACGGVTGGCAACLDTPGCGWCDGSDVCVAGGFTGPAGGAHGSTCGVDYDYYAPWCDNSEAECETALSCRECVGNASRGCAWGLGTHSCVSDPTAVALPATTADGCPNLCEGEGSPCPGECCEGLSCIVGSCADCSGKKLATDSCDPTVVGECCGYLSCSPIAGGGNTCCHAQAEPCTRAAECCGDMECSAGSCQCQAPGESCQSARECCGSAICGDNVCVR